MLKITTLFSGSKGNCSLLQSDKVNILLDLGYGYASTVARLKTMNLTPSDISAIVITHEHTDHIAALPMWTKKCSTTVYAPKGIADFVRQRAYVSEVVEVDGSFIIGDVTVDTYECSHDAVSCLGYRFTSQGESIASVTDTGCVSQALIDFLSPCKTVQLESNHDVDMLKHGPYHYLLKTRILSDYGHLSNAQTDEVIELLAGTRVKNIILAHLSENNNTQELAFAGAVNALQKRGLVEGKDVKVYVATQRGFGITID